MRRFVRLVIAVIILGSASLARAGSAPIDVPPGFIALFDGETLNGWNGDARVWSIVDGRIVGRSNAQGAANTFLIHDTEFANFELRFKYRWRSTDGNSGVAFRSRPIIGNFALTGMQANVIPGADRPERFGMLYDEGSDRNELALLGQRAEISRAFLAGGSARIVRSVSEMVNSRDDVIAAVREGPEWTEVVVVAYDNHIVSAINGLLAFDAIDNDPRRLEKGVVGLQYHLGGGWIEYKDIFIKPLNSPQELSGRFQSKATFFPAPHRTYKESPRPGMPDKPLSIGDADQLGLTP